MCSNSRDFSKLYIYSDCAPSAALMQEHVQVYIHTEIHFSSKKELLLHCHVFRINVVQLSLILSIDVYYPYRKAKKSLNDASVVGLTIKKTLKFILLFFFQHLKGFGFSKQQKTRKKGMNQCTLD